MALLLALAIIAIGTQYIVSPTTATRSFGLPLPEIGQSPAKVIENLRPEAARFILEQGR